MHAFVVLGFVFPYQAKRLAWRTYPKLPILCQMGRQTVTQSISFFVVFLWYFNVTLLYFYQLMRLFYFYFIFFCLTYNKIGMCNIR